jgi:23S rRNA (adenine2503-C2)-methyltransferase
MTNLPAALRARLDETFRQTDIHIKEKHTSTDGTVKYLFALDGGDRVESVLMRYRHGNTVCLSTQAGCRMGCVFCASGRHGLRRNLTMGEIMGQARAIAADTGERVDGIVLMGMGEPLNNTLRFLRLITHPKGQNISQRRISLSTCGLVPQIEQLATEGLGVTLSVSLHAPNDDLRDSIMPINRKYPIAQLLAACKHYSEKTSRRISVEYALLRGVNDTPAHARELAAQLQGMLCHVNLIPANEVGRGYEASSPEHVQRFAQTLLRHKINATVRRSLGKDIDAACGQLRNRTESR